MRTTNEYTFAIHYQLAMQKHYAYSIHAAYTYKHLLMSCGDTAYTRMNLRAF